MCSWWREGLTPNTRSLRASFCPHPLSGRGGTQGELVPVFSSRVAEFWLLSHAIRLAFSDHGSAPSTQTSATIRARSRAAPSADPAERHAWTLLRNRGVLGLKFRRQHVLHGFIVDFYCASEHVVIELEGDAHDGDAQQIYDRARAEFLAAAGFRIIRVRNKDVSREHFQTRLRQVL